LVFLCVHSKGGVSPHPHQEVNTGVPRVKVAAAEVKFGLQSISEGGRREREQVNTGSMVYYNHRCKQCTCSCVTAINKNWRGSGLGMRLARKYGTEQEQHR